MAREAGDFIHFLMQRDAFLQVLELHGAADFREDGEGVGVPLNQRVALRDLLALLHLELGAVNHRVALFFAALIVNNHDGAGAVHDNQIAGLGLDGLQVDEAHGADAASFQARLLRNSRCRTADVAGTHGELRAGFTDGLRRDDAGGFAQFDGASGSQVAAIAGDAHAALRFAGEHGADLDALNAGSLNGRGQLFRDFLVHVYDHAAFIVFDFLERNAAHNAVAQRLDDVTGFHDGADVNSVHSAAILLADNHVLSDVNQAAGEVAGIRGLERRIRKALARAVRGYEVLEHRETFTEVGRDGCFNDFARRLGHEAAHARELANLLFGSASAGVSHDVNRVHRSGLVQLLHVVEHLVGHFFRDVRPDFNHFVVALTVGDGAVQVLLLNVDDLLFRFSNQVLLVVRNDHVINADGEAGSGCKAEADLLNFVEHFDRDFQAKAQVGVVHQLANTLLLEQAVDERHVFRQMIVQDGAAHGGVDELTFKLHRISVHDVLIVIGLREVNDFTRVAQADGRKRFHFAGFESEQHFVNVGESAAFTLGARLAFGQVVETEHHVLRGHGDGLA